MLGNFTESLKGTLGGVVLIIVSFPILFLNEGRSVDVAKGLEEGAALVVSINPTQDLGKYDGKLIHASGEAKAGAKIKDSDFAIDEAGLGLFRTVEMYQWKEEVTEDSEKKSKKEYTYHEEWSSFKIDSSKFKEKSGHSNPNFPYEAETFYADSVTLGNIDFSTPLIQSIPTNDELTYDQATINRLKAKFGAKAKIHDGQIYLGKDPAEPEIGDIRVSHKIAPEGTASVIGLLDGNSLNGYQTKRDTTILVFSYGKKDAATMFREEQEANTFLTWILRLVGFLVMFFGFKLLFGPIAAAGGWIPILGGILEMGVSLVAGILSFSLSFTTIAIAWIFFRPLLGIGLLLLGGGAFAFLMYQKGKFGNKPPVTN
ncbi:TMEM43 family protein [Leptospira idonii]|uniref:Uncharacterized protein n=1 Tax=Leptospira idonii TaxID=1193500 RepID=A0A4R9M106_9LEPT|nr:TMEM43 family protein [Leptospira idonii]TGN19631.1 hypothetical protein EHS15_07555 [Leptospira idonii]